MQDDFIMKELEDYVNEKKQTNKYLDDISDYDTHSNNKSKQRLSKKQKDPKMTNDQTQSQSITDQQSLSNIEIYDYCDKMIKDLSHQEK